MAYEALRERFEAKYAPEPNSGCWLWTGVLGRNGYGRIWKDGRHLQAHRIAYEAVFGAIPAGLVLDHLCRVRCCVNPAHLEAVTAAENIRRGETGKVTGARLAARTHCRHGHALQGDNVIVTSKQRFCRQCHRDSGRRRWLKSAAGRLNAAA